MNVLRNPRGRLTMAAAAALAALFAGCGGSKPRNLAGECQVRFEKLHARFEKQRYAAAKEGYADFVASCAGTEFVEEAYFELAESHFALKEWMEAEQEYRSFLREYPGSRRYGETARYKLAVSMAKQTSRPNRDQSKTLDAIHEFETFLADFSDTPRADSARSELGRLRGLLAERDLLIARLYGRMDEPLAAVVYYKHILKEYGDEIPRREIVLKLAESYVELGQFLEAENQLAQFDGIAKDDPFLEKVRAARRKLEAAQARHAREKRQEHKEEQKKSDSASKSM